MNITRYNLKSNTLIQNKFILFLLLIYFISTRVVIAQKKSELLNKAEDCLKSQDYVNSNYYWKMLLNRDSINLYYIHNYGFTSYKIYDLKNAEYYLRKSISKDLKKEYNDDQFYLGLTLKLEGKYIDAKKELEKYYRRNRKSNSVFSNQCLKEIEGCIYAIQNKASKLKIQLLDSNINSMYAENSPFIKGDTLYFTAKSDSLHYAIYMAMKKNNGYNKKSKVIELQSANNNISNLTIEDTTAYFTINELDDNKNSTTIYKAGYHNGKFYEIAKLDENINRLGSINTQAGIAKMDNGNYLIFVSDRESGEGGMDVYQSKIIGNGKYENPTNLGSIINTPGNEITPYFCNHCNTLFFSSNYHAGIGGYDIFKSNYIDGKFSKPENLGKPINSSLNDIYFSYDHEKELAFLSSNRKGSRYERNEFCCNDIYKIYIKDSLNQGLEIKKDTISISTKIDSVTIKIDLLKNFLPLQLYFENDEPDRKTMAITTNKTYSETVIAYMQKRDEYLKYYLKGIKKSDSEDSKLQLYQFFEDSIRDATIKLNYCNSLMEYLLNSGKTIRIKIKGYCSPLASTDYNKNLAKRRINSLVNELKNYNHGSLKKHLDSNHLILVEEELGESESSNYTSDNPNDVSNSVYSIRAALERKISIMKVIVD